MTQYTSFTQSDFLSVLNEYGIHELSSWKVLSGGSENTNYLITTKENQFVLTVCEQKTEQAANELAQLLSHLTTNNFATSKLIRTSDNQLITIYQNKPILLKEYLPGEIIENLSFPLLTLIGQELGLLHQINAPEYLPHSFSYGIESFSIIEKYAKDSSFHYWLYQIREYIVKTISSDLPKTLIHGDLFYSNVIIDLEKNTATIMDFEEACHYYRAFDLGMSIVGLCREKDSIDLKKVKSLLNGYQLQTQITSAEWDCLKAFTVYGAAATAFWRHKQYHYVHPDIDFQNHYLDMKNLADEVLSLDDDCFREFRI